MYCLRSPQVPCISCLAFFMATPAFKPPLSYWYNTAGTKRHVPEHLQTRAMQVLAATWTGGLWDCPAHSVWTALAMLPTVAEQETCIQVMTTYVLNPKETAMRRPESTTLPPDVLNKLEMSLASLEQALLDKDPLMPQHLRTIHSTTLTYPESVHLLEDAEIARIIQGLEIHTKVQIVKEAAKGTGGSTAKRKKLDIGDL